PQGRRRGCPDRAGEVWFRRVERPGPPGGGRRLRATPARRAGGARAQPGDSRVPENRLGRRSVETVGQAAKGMTRSRGLTLWRPVMLRKRLACCLVFVGTLFLITCGVPTARAYVEAPYSLGRIISERSE